MMSRTTSKPSDGGPVIDIRNVTVRYRVPRERVRTFKEFAINWVRGRVVYEDLLALSDVSFQVARGETIGIIGRNGAGKTTLLKAIARVLRPSEGTVAVRGRTAPLLELGAGFDMELSGRENVYLNGAILGRSRQEMRQRLQHIIDFSELGDFIDAPLRTYSTGMIARLGFAVATDVEPDLLLIDEALAVGDVAFQQKCFDRIETMRSQATLVLVTHSLDVVRGVCDRAVWLDHGRVVMDGPAPDTVTAFIEQTMGSAPRAANL
jgi:ABC-type polysaccharide/polyol phosphate transport system ATPase subunit